MAEFYSARGWEIPPLPWTNLSPPFSDIAGQYKFGTTTIAGGYLNNESNVKGSDVQADEVDVWTLGVSHNFASAPGLRAWAEVVQYEVDSAGTPGDNDATYFMIGTQVAF